ncbi:UNVERIFIED_CONTAM: hypothetical protein FKN15_070576 [Acipenser sinensis]
MEDILSIGASDEVGKQELAFRSAVQLSLSAELLLIKRATAVLQVPWPTEGVEREQDNDKGGMFLMV